VIKNLQADPWTPLALVDLHLDVLYERDDAGHILRARGTAIAAPDFHLVRTVDGNRWATSAAMSEDEGRALRKALSREPVVGTLDEMKGRAPVVSALSLPAGKRPPSADYRGPAFRFPEPLPQVPEYAELLHDPRDARTVPELAWIRAVTQAEHPLTVARNSSGEVVSVCHSARATAGGAEAGVETAPGYRGRGLAGAVVLVWAHAVLADGRVPLYSTQWTNHASRAVARKLGLIAYGEDYHCP